MDEKRLTHIDLFSGIGGFTLAAEWAGFKTVSFCEKDAFCQKVLQKRFGGIIANPNSIESQEKPGDDEEVCKIQKTKCKSRYGSPISRGGDKPQGIPIIPEIRDFDGTKYRGATLLTGGFPCQPFSVAGQRRGKEDDRYLWPEMLRVIDEARPHWILAENVPGIFRMALDTVLSDLESKGYTTGTFIIPACGLNAPHRRNRVWIIANARCQHGEGTENKGEFKRPIFEEEDASLLERPIKDDGLRDACDTSSDRYPGRCEKARRTKREGEQRGMRKFEGANSHAQNAIGTGARDKDRKINNQKRKGSQDRREGIRQKDGEISSSRIAPTNKYAPDSTGGRFKECESFREEKRNSGQNAWQENWYEIATRFCRMDDGVSDRVHRLKALGNAIVPQVAYEILKNIAWIEKELFE